MKFFGRKDANALRLPFSNSGIGSAGGAGNPSVTHRVTKDLARAEGLAMMLAASRASSVVEVADLFAGMYIYDWERLSKFWNDQEEIERFLQQICRISPARWHYWIQHYDKTRREDERKPPWLSLRSLKKSDAREISPVRSAELESVLKQAEGIAPFHDTVEGKAIPILTCECVLLSLAKSKDSELGSRLAGSGLDVAKLEQAARNPKHAPLH
jgi:hypothetical protein